MKRRRKKNRWRVSFFSLGVKLSLSLLEALCSLAGKGAAEAERGALLRLTVLSLRSFRRWRGRAEQRRENASSMDLRERVKKKRATKERKSSPPFDRALCLSSSFLTNCFFSLPSRRSRERETRRGNSCQLSAYLFFALTCASLLSLELVRARVRVLKERGRKRKREREREDFHSCPIGQSILLLFERRPAASSRFRIPSSTGSALSPLLARFSFTRRE